VSERPGSGTASAGKPELISRRASRNVFSSAAALPTKPGYRGDLLDGGKLQAAHRAESLEERGLALFANTREIIQDTLGNPLEPELGVVGVGEPVGFIPDPLEQV
jgi:hypothetical protein